MWILGLKGLKPSHVYKYVSLTFYFLLHFLHVCTLRLYDFFFSPKVNKVYEDL